MRIKDTKQIKISTEERGHRYLFNDTFEDENKLKGFVMNMIMWGIVVTVVVGASLVIFSLFSK